MGHVGQKLRFHPGRLLSPLLGHIQFDVLDLDLLQGLAQIRGGLIDVHLHLVVIFGDGLGHGVDAVLQHVEFAAHLASDPGIEPPLADLVDGAHHAVDGIDDHVDQVQATVDAEPEAEQDDEDGHGSVAVLDDQRPIGVHLDRDIADGALWLAVEQRAFGQGDLFEDRRAQYDEVILVVDRGQLRDGFALGQAQHVQPAVKIRGDEELVVFPKDGDGVDEGGVLAMGQAEQSFEQLPAVLLHAIFAGDGQRLDDADALLDDVGLELLVPMEREVTGEQATDDQGRQYGERQDPRAESIFGHSQVLVGQCRT